MSAAPFQPIVIPPQLLQASVNIPKAPEDLSEKYFLGVDIGTSKIAAVLYDPVQNVPKFASTVEIPPMLSSDSAEVKQFGNCGEKSGKSEGPAALWNADEILIATAKAISSLPKEALSLVRGICAAGQMHGVVVLADGRPVTPFANWQDQSCSRGFLEKLRSKTGCSSLSQGHGTVTLARWAACSIPPFDSDRRGIIASTIMDYFCATLCDDPDYRIRLPPSIDPTNANAWGMCDKSGSCWNEEALKSAGLSSFLLPRIVSSGSVIGRTAGGFAATQCGLPLGVPVCVAVGDFQAAFYASIASAAKNKSVNPERCLSLNIGTSAQLAVLVPSNSKIVKKFKEGERKSYELRPYLDDRFSLVTAAAMMGGSAWSAFVDTVAGWCNQIGGGSPDRETVQKRLEDLGMKALKKHKKNPKSEETLLCVDPRFAGEREDPDARGAVTGLTATNARDIGDVAVAFAFGIIQNLQKMLPREVSSSEHTWTVIGSGNAIRNSALFREAARVVLGNECTVAPSNEEAATGAAMFAAFNLSPR